MTDGAPSDGEIDLQPLISKLGHGVEEIRVRSLKNIIFKLDHDLICVGDVVHKKAIFIKLLEWFNFDPCANQKEVLQLLEKLSKHSSGLETLVGIGGIEFLSHLRQDVDPSLYQLVDNVLNNLLSLPEILPDGDDEYQLLYYERGKSSGILESNENSAASVEVAIPTKSQETIHSSLDVGRKLVHLPNSLTEEQRPFDQGQYFDKNPTEYRDHELHLGEVEKNREGTGTSWRYPWIRLADSDRHILSTTNTRLQSHNPSLVKKSCEFLNDVLFKDFPAEIFLQRPSIVMTLLTLLEVKSLENHFLPVSAASCLSHLCVHLRQRYLLVSDPAWYSLHPDCWKHWLGYGSSSSSATVSPASELSDLRTTGDGGERSSDSSKTESEHYVEAEEEDGLVREALEMNQMSLEEFSLQVMRGCCPLLNTVGDPLILLEALWEALKLLQVSRPGYQWWNNYNIKPLRREICRVVARTLTTHLVKCGLQPSEGEDIVEHNISRHAMIVINTSLWIINFLYPFIQTEWDDESSTQDLGEVFRALVLNEILFSTYPEIRTCLERCPFVMDDPEFVDVYNRALAIKTSLIASVKFLKEMRLKANTHQDVLIGMLEPCLLSLPYHQNLELITHAIKLISTVFERSHLCAETKSKAKGILLCLLSNADDVVRQRSYECCAVLAKDALKYSHVTNPVSSYCYKAMFVVDRDVLYTVCAFGMVDQNEEILDIATKILETFLENRLNMSSDLRKKLLDDLLTSLLFLQMHLDKRNKLGTCLMGLLASPGESPHSLTADGEVVPFSQFERLRGSLRCMFLRDKTMRAKGYGYLIRRLVDEDLKRNREFVYPRGNLENSSDLFILETFASSIRLHRSTKHANFDDEKIRKLFDIVAMESTDVSLRKSSAEQLAVLMQDPDLHNVLLDIVAEDALLGILEESLAKDGRVHISSIVNPKLELVPPCLRILRLLSEYNVRCRHKLAQNSCVYHLVVRHALLGPSGGTVRYEVACLLTLFLFDEVAKCPSFEEREKNGGDILFALPAMFLKRYSLPFNPPLYELSNPYQGETPPEPDPLKTEPALSLVRVAWNLAWSDGTNEIPNDLTGKQDDVNEKLTWTSLDSQLLKCCSTKMAVPEAISSILTATSHHTVKLSVIKLSLHLLGENSMKRNQRTADGDVRVRELFYSCDWKTAFERYFTVYPKSADDDRLLIETLKMFRYLIQESSSPPPISFLGWLAHVIMAPDSSVVVLLSSPSPSKEQPPDASVSESKRMLRKELLGFLSIFVRKLRSLAKPWLWSGEMVYVGDVTLSLTLNLNLTDSPQYYDLPILESTLQCLVEITAIPCFSTASKFVDPKELCVELLSSLLQVFTAFHAGRLGAFTSFMGRGVTLCVSLCLVHLVHEMSSALKLQDWPTLFATVADKESSSDVSWLSSMWTDHLPEVRWCSLAIATHIVTHTGSPLAIKQNFAGGLWNLAVIILMDGKECCLVRDQAVLLFSALLSSLKRNGDLHEAETGLSVQTETEIISGVPALHLLLAHHQFYSSFRQMLRNVVFENSPQLPGTATFAESLSSNSTRSKYGIPYHSLDTDSQRSDSVGGRSVSDSTKMPSSSSSSHSGESSRRLLEVSSATSSVVTSTAVSGTSRPSSTIPLITRSKTGSELGRNDVRSSNSPASMDSLEILAWVTPRFVGSLSGLVTNLVCVCPETVLNEVKDEDVLGLFISQLDGKHAISLITQLQNTSSRSRHRHLEINLIDTLDMYSEIAVLMKTCAAKDHIIAHAIQQNTAILDRLLELLAINSCKLSGGVQISCYKMWGSVVELLLTLLKRIKESQLLETPLEEILLKLWKVFAAAFEHVMSSSENFLRTCFLHLLSHVLLREGKRMTSGGGVTTSLSDMLDESSRKKEEDSSEMMRNGDTGVQKNERKTTTDKKKDEFEGNGSELCSILLSTYKNLQEETATTNHNNEESHFVMAALKNLFCISQAAKKTAVKAGFLATSLDKIKQLHVQLNMESLEVGKGSGTRKKEMDLISEIIKVLELLKNLVFRSHETKLEAINDGVISVLQQLWSWCTVVKILRLAVLDLMCTLTARCSQASIAMSNTSTGLGSTVRLGPSNNTFVHCVIKMTSKMCNKLLNNSTGDGNLASCQILFSLLKNTAMTPECRGILWKSNFITEFSRLKSLSHQKWKASQKTVVILWLELLANISFHRDGQQMIVKIDSVIPLLLEFSGSNTKKVNESALLVLRNLCFHVPSKTLLLSNSEVVELLLRSVDKSSIYVRALASSALWALLTNNQKAKSILGKPALVVKRLSDSKHTLKPTTQGSDVNTGEGIQRKHYEDAVENILKILRC